MDKLPPGPAYIPRWNVPQLIRIYGSLLRDPIAFVSERFAEYGDIYYVDEGGGSRLYVIRHPDTLHELLVTRHADMQKRGGANDRLVSVLGDGLLTADGDVWKRSRKLMNPRFHRKAIAGYAQTMIEHVERISLDDGAEVDVGALMRRLTLHIVVKALFDHDVQGDDDRVTTTMEALNDASRASLLPAWLPTPRTLRTRRAVRHLHGLIDGLVLAREQEGLREDLLSMLLDVGLERRLVRDQLVTLFLAGHETTSHALTWALWLLSHHPDVLARLQEEVDAAGELSEELELPFTDAVASEAMRLYPPAYALPRVARVDTELGGYQIPAGSQIIGWIWHAHHDPRFWDDAEAFRPERFLEPLKKREAYLPFGGGPRMCIGSGFARLELRLIIASLVRRYRFEAHPGQTIAIRPGVTLAPKGTVNLKVSRRVT